jgi:hypothetical protein
MTLPTFSDRPSGQCDGTREDDDAHDDAVLDRMSSAELAARGERKDERRKAARGPSPMADEFVSLRNRLTLALATVLHLRDELTNLRAIIAAQRELLEQSDMRAPSPNSVKP